MPIPETLGGLTDGPAPAGFDGSRGFQWFSPEVSRFPGVQGPNILSAFKFREFSYVRTGFANNPPYGGGKRKYPWHLHANCRVSRVHADWASPPVMARKSARGFETPKTIYDRFTGLPLCRQTV